jgi:ribosomal protein L16/L10AE
VSCDEKNELRADQLETRENCCKKQIKKKGENWLKPHQLFICSGLKIVVFFFYLLSLSFS